MIFLSARQLSQASNPELSLSMLPKEVFSGAVLGFLSFKLPLLIRNLAEARYELFSNKDAQLEMKDLATAPTGSVGMAARFFATSLAQNAGETTADAANTAVASTSP